MSRPVSADDPLPARLGALSHAARLMILRQLGENACCCCKDVVGGMNLAQSTVSQHLKVLVDAGLVVMRQDGQRSIYRIDRAAMAELAEAVTALVSACCPESRNGRPNPDRIEAGND